MGHERTDQIFDLLNQGFTTDQINTILAQRKQHSESLAQRGVKSELLAKNFLNSLNYVASATIISDRESADAKMRDIEVVINKPVFEIEFARRLVIPGNLIWVQVKSSNYGIDIAIAGLVRRTNISPSQIDRLLYERRLIFLNARDDDNSNRSYFATQIDRMDYYWGGQKVSA